MRLNLKGVTHLLIVKINRAAWLQRRLLFADSAGLGLIRSVVQVRSVSS